MMMVRQHHQRRTSPSSSSSPQRVPHLFWRGDVFSANCGGFPNFTSYYFYSSHCSSMTSDTQLVIVFIVVVLLSAIMYHCDQGCDSVSALCGVAFSGDMKPGTSTHLVQHLLLFTELEYKYRVRFGKLLGYQEEEIQLIH